MRAIKDIILILLGLGTLYAYYKDDIHEFKDNTFGAALNYHELRDEPN